ncbi:MAG: phosphoribosylanthranilate isomerase [Lachnospiraceae bacterium]|nr:phosphoribosylanthranilate isomerase [Lachnospiraceae bacterium]
MTKIKLCGLMTEKDIETVNDLRPDYIGFVFAEKSRRYVDRETAARLRKLLDPSITAVGVFVNEDMSFILDILKAGIIDIAQLHGTESEDYILRLKQESGRQVIKAFRISGPNDLAFVERSPADHILLDAGAGDGKTFDWSLLSGIKRPFFLAGGLTSENAASAVKELGPYAVDTSSGIETDGKKDPEKMRAFVNAVRSIG